MSSCPVCTPNGTAGSTTTLAPASQARLADSAATYSVAYVSVPYGRWRLCASVAPHGRTATSYLVFDTVFHGVSASMYGLPAIRSVPPVSVPARPRVARASTSFRECVLSHNPGSFHPWVSRGICSVLVREGMGCGKVRTKGERRPRICARPYEVRPVDGCRTETLDALADRSEGPESTRTAHGAPEGGHGWPRAPAPLRGPGRGAMNPFRPARRNRACSPSSRRDGLAGPQAHTVPRPSVPFRTEGGLPRAPAPLRKPPRPRLNACSYTGV